MQGMEVAVFKGIIFVRLFFILQASKRNSEFPLPDRLTHSLLHAAG